jgi:hypothetical protein
MNEHDFALELNNAYIHGIKRGVAIAWDVYMASDKNPFLLEKKLQEIIQAADLDLALNTPPERMHNA